MNQQQHKQQQPKMWIRLRCHKEEQEFGIDHVVVGKNKKDTNTKKNSIVDSME